MSRTPGPVPPAENPHARRETSATWPVVVLVLTLDGRATVNGRTLTPAKGDDVRRHLMGEAARMAATLGRDVGVTATDPSGTRHLIAHPDGTFDLVDAGNVPWSRSQTTDPLPVMEPQVRTPPASPSAPPPVPQAAPKGPASPFGPTGNEVRVIHLSTEKDPEGPSRQGPQQGAGRQKAAPPPHPYLAPREGPGLTDTPPALRTPPPAPTPPALRTTARETVPVTDGLALRRVRRPVAAGVGLGVVLLIIIAATVMSQPWRSETGTATRPPTGEAAANEAGDASGRGAIPALPGKLPGFSVRTTWTAEVAQWTKVAARGSVVATRDSEGRIIQLDPGKGTVTHRSASRWGEEWDGPWLTHIDDREVLALASTTTLAYWPVPQASDQAASDRAVSEPSRLVLPAGAKVTWNGTTPLVTAGAAVWVIGEGTLRRIPIPPKARPLAADGSAVLAVLAGTWIRATATGFQAHAVPPPPGASGPPARMVDVAGRYLLTVWTRKGKDTQKISFVDTQTAKVLFNSVVPAGADIARAGVIRQVSGVVTAVGQVVIDPGAQKLSALLPQYTPMSLVEGHVYATTQASGKTPGAIVDIVPKQPSGFSVLEVGKDAPVPFALVTPGGKPLALAIAPAGSQWYLAAVAAADEK